MKKIILLLLLCLISTNAFAEIRNLPIGMALCSTAKRVFFEPNGKAVGYFNCFGHMDTVEGTRVVMKGCQGRMICTITDFAQGLTKCTPNELRCKHENPLVGDIGGIVYTEFLNQEIQLKMDTERQIPIIPENAAIVIYPTLP